MLLYQIIGMSWRSGQGVLLATDHGATWRSKDYIAVGAGREHASILLSQIMPEARPLPAERAAYLAAYVIYQVKEYIEGCGKKTQVVVLKHGKGEYLSKEKIALLEYRFGSYSDLNTLSLNYILGRPVKDEKAAAETLAKYLSLIRRDNKTLSHQTVTSQGWSLDWNDIQRQSSGPAPLPVEATIKSTAKLYPPSMSGGDTPLPLRQEAEEKTK
jgi:hypothetical protein